MSNLDHSIDHETDKIYSYINIGVGIVKMLIRELVKIEYSIIYECECSEQQRLLPLALIIKKWIDDMEDNIFNSTNLSVDGKVYVVCPDTYGIEAWTEHAQAYMTAFNRDFHSRYVYGKPGHKGIHEPDKWVIEGVLVIAGYLGVEIDIHAGFEDDEAYEEMI